MTGNAIIRLHGSDPKGIQAGTRKYRSSTVEPRGADLRAPASMMQDLKVRRRNPWVFVDNHHEDCAPPTIERIKERLQ